jgi:hypothetical protein
MFTFTFATQPWIGDRNATLREMLSAVSEVGSTPMSRNCSPRERKVTFCVLSSAVASWNTLSLVVLEAFRAFWRSKSWVSIFTLPSVTR